MSHSEVSRFIAACKQAAATHSHPWLCLDLAMRAKDRLMMRELNEALGARGYNISEPLIANGHRS